jgi:hypothetical protein
MNEELLGPHYRGVIYKHPHNVREVKVMAGAAIWCSQGTSDIRVNGALTTIPGHAFSSDDPNAEIVSRTIHVKNENGVMQNVTKELHICGPCMKATDPFGEHVDEDKVKKLEAWNEGYEAAKQAYDDLH